LATKGGISLSNEQNFPSVEESAELFHKIAQEVFFGRLADYGIVPANEKQAQAILRSAAIVEQIAQTPQVKQAEQANDPFSQLEQGLQKIAADYGVDVGADLTQNDNGIIDQLALSFMSSPDVYKAAMVLGSAQAGS
jgi:hypothetical protein